MVKSSPCPGLSRMAAAADLAKGTIVIILMAGYTTRRGTLENIVNMAACTGSTGMRTGQLER